MAKEQCNHGHNVKEVGRYASGHCKACRQKEALVRYHKNPAKQYLRKKSNYPSYVNWQNMMQRCYYSKACNFKFYGAKGVIVYGPWHDYHTFVAQFGKFKPGLGYTISRFKDKGNYEPGNVEWVHKTELKNERV